MKKYFALFVLLILSSGCLEDQEFPAYDAKKNYCGPEGKLSGPKTNLLSQASFNEACYGHDKCYAECAKTHNTQAFCDGQFRKTMDDSCDAELNRLMTKCETYSKWNPVRYGCVAKVRVQISSCWAQASTYHNLVHYAGKPIGSFTCDDSKWA